MTHYTLLREALGFASGVYGSIEEAQVTAIKIFAGVCGIRENGLEIIGSKFGNVSMGQSQADLKIVEIAQGGDEDNVWWITPDGLRVGDMSKRK